MATKTMSPFMACGPLIGMVGAPGFWDGRPLSALATDSVDGVSVSRDELLVAFIAPPWGDALHRISGLDLRRTTPPITDVVDFLLHKYSRNRLLCAIQVYEIVVPAAIADVRIRFDWSTLRISELNAPGQNHGLLLGTKGWVPRTDLRDAHRDTK